MTVLAGTSGWQYRDWRGVFYPPGVPQRRWLEHYAQQFATVENNGTFYRLPARDTFTSWRNRVPGDFVMTVKAQPLPDPRAAAALSAWAEWITGRITGNGDAYAYFNNDQHGAAPRDAGG